MKGTELRIWVDEFDFSSATSQVDVNIESGEAEDTSLASTAQEFEPLLAKTTVAQNGYFRGVLPAGFAAELEARFGAGDAIVTVITEQSDPNCACYVLPAAANYNMVFGSPVNGLVTLNGQWGTSVAAQRGLRVADDSWVDTVGLIPGITDFDFAPITRGVAYFHIYEIEGAAVDASISIESAVVMTFGEVGALSFSSIGGYRVELSGPTLGQFIRLNCTSLGGATRFKFTAVVCLE
jgi:hypothetical protein